MKDTELRLGNWVMHGNTWCHRNENAGGGGYFEFQWEYKDWYGLGESTMNIDDVEPILLTPSWVTAFGLAKWKDKNIWTKKGVMIYSHSKHGICYGKAASRTKLKYVHQLQNLYFALKNEELNI